MSLLYLLLPMLLSIVVAIGLAGYLFVRERNYPRQSPLTRKLLRPPGYSLRVSIQKINEDMLFSFLGMLFVPFVVFAGHVCQTAYGGVPESIMRITVSAVAGLGAAAFFAIRLSRDFLELKWKSLGLDGEMFVGEELNQLMQSGCMVFHDVPYDHGNIDHVVVSRSGVYSVNTKMVGKPKSGGANVVVDHQKGIVEFPDRVWKLPAPQLECEANWLSRRLSKSTGQQIDVEPILALPGWFISKRIGRSSVYVINPLEPEKFFVQNRQVLSPAQIEQITFQLDQLCRDLDPAFRSKKAW